MKANHKSAIRLTVLDNGRMHPDIRELEGPMATDKGQRIEIPIYSVLIEHPEGLVLFDAGCHPQSMGKTGRWSTALQESFPWHAKEDDLLLQRLLNLGIHPKNIRYVVCSHLHCDHAGNLEFFPDSEIVVHADEWKAAWKEYEAGNRDGEFVYDDLSAWCQVGLNTHLVASDVQSLVLLPGITVHNLGRGHSYGMLVVEVEQEDERSVILASDAAFSSTYYGNGSRAPALSVDSSGYLRGARKIEQLAQAHDAEVWFGHDLRQFMSLKQKN